MAGLCQIDRQILKRILWGSAGANPTCTRAILVRMAKQKPTTFTWDPEKATRNEEKYGVTFDEASSVFRDKQAVYFDDDAHSQNEKREMVIGKSAGRGRLLTCFFARGDGEIRLISARISTHRERREYDDNSDKRIIYQVK